MNTTSTFSQLTEPGLFRLSHPHPSLEQCPCRRVFKQRKLFPKAPLSRIQRHTLLTAALAAIAAPAFQNGLIAATEAIAPPVIMSAGVQQTYPGMPWLDNSKAPFLDYSKLPWLNKPAHAQTETVTTALTLAEKLHADIDSAISNLTTLADSYKIDRQEAKLAGEATSLATDLSTLQSRDLSALCSQDLSVNCGQLLSTSLAVPTAPARPQRWRQNHCATLHRRGGAELCVDS